MDTGRVSGKQKKLKVRCTAAETARAAKTKRGWPRRMRMLSPMSWPAITPAPMTAKKVALACASSDPETRSESATEVRPVPPHMVTATQPKVRPRTTSQ